MKQNEVDYKTPKSYKIEIKTSPCRASKVENAALQYSALPAELQRWSVNLRQTAVMNIFTYYMYIFRTPARRVCVDTSLSICRRVLLPAVMTDPTIS